MALQMWMGVNIRCERPSPAPPCLLLIRSRARLRRFTAPARRPIGYTRRQYWTRPSGSRDSAMRKVRVDGVDSVDSVDNGVEGISNEGGHQSGVCV